jgi:hypothetical protein
MINLETLSARIEIDDKLSPILRQLSDRVQKFSNDFDESMRGMQSGMTRAAGIGSFLGTTLSNLALRAVSFTKNLISGSAMAGARLEQLTVATRFLGEKAGYTAEYIDNLSEKIEKSGIDGISARESIVQLLGAHIDLGKATQLSTIAQNMQSISGRSSSETFQLITRAISTMNPMLLRQIGFTSTLSNVMDEYEETTGKTASTLTGLQKQQLVLNSVLKEGAEKAGLYGESMKTAGKQASSAERAWDQVSQQLGTILLPITNVVIKSWYKLGESIRDAVKDSQGSVKAFVQGIADGLQNLIDKTKEFVGKTVEGIKAVIAIYYEIPEPIRKVGIVAAEAAVGVYVLNSAIQALSKTAAIQWSLGASRTMIASLVEMASWFGISSAAAKAEAAAIAANAAAKKKAAAVAWTRGFNLSEAAANAAALKAAAKAEASMTQVTAKLGPLATAWGGLTARLAAISGVLMKVGGAIVTFLVSPIGLAVTAVATLAGALRLLTGSWEFILTPLRKAWQAFKDVWTIVWEGLIPAFKDLMSGLTGISTLGLSDHFLGQLDSVRERLHDIWTWLKASLVPLNQLITGLQLLGIVADGYRQQKANEETLAGMKASGLASGMGSRQSPLAGLSGLDSKAVSSHGGLKTTPTPERLSDELQKVHDKLFGHDVIKNAKDMVAVLGGVKNLTKLSEEQQRALNKSVLEAIDAYHHLGEKAPKNILEIRNATQANLKVFAEIKFWYEEWPKIIADTNAQAIGIEREYRETVKGETRANYELMTDMYRASADIVNGQQLTSLENQLKNLDRWVEDSRLKVVKNRENTENAYAAIAATAEQKLDEIMDAQSLLSMDAAVNAQKTSSAWGRAFKDIAANVQQAILGGGNVFKGITGTIGQHLIGDEGKGFLGSKLMTGVGKVADKIGGGLTGIGSKLLKGAMAFIPGLGPLIGKGVELLAKGLGKLFGMGTAGRDTVREFEKVMGGSDALRKKLNVLGTEGERLWVNLTQKVGKNDKKAAEAAIKAITKALEELSKTQAKVTEQLSAMSELVVKFGGVAPASMRGYINELLKSTKLTEEHRKLLEGLAKEPSWEKIQEAAERYGLATDHLGQKFNQLKSNSVFDQLFSDWTLFSDIGADSGATFDAMSAKVSEALNKAKKFGLAVPEYMRPLLESMLKAGKLTDEAGNALSDLGDVKFSASIESSLEKIAKILQKIADLLAGVNPELRDIGAGGDQRIHRPVFKDTGDFEVTTTGAEVSGSKAGAGTPVSISFQAWDGASTEAWLRRGGDRQVTEAVIRALERNDSAGAPVSFVNRIQTVVGNG